MLHSFFLHLDLLLTDRSTILSSGDSPISRFDSPDSEKNFSFNGKSNTSWTIDGACRLSHGGEAPRGVEDSHHVYPLSSRGPGERLLACSSLVSAGTATSALTFSVVVSFRYVKLSRGVSPLCDSHRRRHQSSVSA